MTYVLLFDNGKISCKVDEVIIKEFARLMSKEKNVVAIIKLKP